MNIRKSFAAAVTVLVLGSGLAACTIGSSGQAPAGQTAAQKEAKAQGQDSYNLVNNQPVPVFQFSQERQTLINVEEIQANGENTTSFFFNMGVADPIMTCSSIGMPVASSAELTNPFQAEWNDGTGGNNAYAIAGVPVGQMDPTGIYTGDSTGTNVLCVNAQGQQYIQYWEGFVDAVSGPAVWDSASHTVKLLGAPDHLDKTPTAVPSPKPTPSKSK